MPFHKAQCQVLQNDEEFYELRLGWLRLHCHGSTMLEALVSLARRLYLSEAHSSYVPTVVA